MITLTQRAAERIKKVFADTGTSPDTVLRLGIKGGGCSGFSYTLDVAGRAAPDDEQFESHGVKVVCDPKSYLYLAGTEVDYEDKLIGGGFVFNNPNAKGRCGCGASFRV